MTSKAGPSNVACRPVVSRLKLPLCASADDGLTVSRPMRGLQPSAVPLSKVALAPVVLPGGPGGPWICAMLMLST